jgi:hypothetical protein
VYEINQLYAPPEAPRGGFIAFTRQGPLVRSQYRPPFRTTNFRDSELLAAGSQPDKQALHRVHTPDVHTRLVIAALLAFREFQTSAHI